MRRIAGTGSRSFVSDKNKEFTFDTWINSARDLYGEIKIISGMAEGWDEFIARRAVARGVPFIAAVPNRTYGKWYWGEHSTSGQKRYQEFCDLLAQADEVVYVCDAIKVRGIHSNFLRNQWMVDNADEFVVYCPTSRGTADCVRRYELAGLPNTEFFRDTTRP